MKIDREFIEVCRKLNEQKVKYVVCGGYAVKLHGVEEISKQERKTVDYDFIIESSQENIKKVKEALKDINPRMQELRDDDLPKYQSVKVVSGNERHFDTDLISRMWGVNYEKASEEMVMKEVEGVKIPVLSINHLLEMKKDSFRARDIADTYWLKKIKEGKL